MTISMNGETGDSKQISESISPESSNIVMDNPCWGGPEPNRHNLVYLLSQIESEAFTSQTTAASSSPELHRDDDKKYDTKNGIILYSSKHYLVINKPPDLRMDGPHPATVHKLLTYWFPPPSLLQFLPATNLTTTSTHNHALAREVSKLHKHNHLTDNILRPTHQLDYATSGVLLVAKSKRAAGVACRAFQLRQTCKEYVAVVHGHVDTKDAPRLESTALNGWTDGSREDAYRKKRRKLGNGGKKSHTFVGFLPIHSVFSKWKGRRIQSQTKRLREDARRGKVESYKKHRDVSPNATVKDQEWLEPNPPLTNEEETQLLQMKWSQVKTNIEWKKRFECMAKVYNDALSDANRNTAAEEHHDKKTIENTTGSSSSCNSSKNQTNLPTIFTLQSIPEATNNDTKVNSDEKEEETAFYIHAPLAEKPDAFHVYVHPSCMATLPPQQHRHVSHFLPGNHEEETMDYKPSLTRCQVLWKGTWKGLKVSKVLLQPRTGRRHQLRLHMAICGHPILGDATYEKYLQSLDRMGTNNSYNDTERNDDINIEQSLQQQQQRISCERMCLHAQSLSLPLLRSDGDDEDNDARNDSCKANSLETMKFIAPDPFLVRNCSTNTFGEDRDDSMVQELII